MKTVAADIRSLVAVARGAVPDVVPFPPADRLPPSLPVEQLESVQDLIDAMFERMRLSRYVALSGPVVGMPVRVVTIDLGGSGRSQIALLNPVVEAVSTERQRDAEGCLLLPGLRTRVERPVHITVRATTRHGQPVRLEAGGILARILQHHIEHLDATTLLDGLPRCERDLYLARRRPGTRS